MANTYTGKEQVANWATHSANPTWTSPGMVQPGGGPADESKPRVRKGIFGQQIMSPGTVSPKGSVEVIARPETKTFMGYALRAAAWYQNSLSDLMFQMGHVDGCRQYDYAVINKMAGKWSSSSEGSALGLTFDFMALDAEDKTDETPYAQAAGTAAVYEDYSGFVTIDGDPWKVLTVDFSVDNGCEFRWFLDTPDTGTIRFPDEIRLGDETHEVSVTFMTDPSIDYDADAPSDVVPVVLNATGTNSSSLVLTWTDLEFEGKPTFAYVAADGDHVWTAKLVGLAGCMAIT